MKKLIIMLILLLTLTSIAFADESLGIGTSVNVKKTTAWERAVDNFFNNPSMIVWPFSYVLGRRVTPFEFYFLIFCIIFIVVFILILIIKSKRRKVK